MRNRERFYDAAMRMAQPLADVLAPLHPKGAAALNGRRLSAATFSEWAATDRDAARPLVLIHAPSVGEALMAQAIVEQVRLQRPDAQIAFTFFSPSAERVAARVGADVHGYLPLDTRRDMHMFVDMLKPSVVAFVRTEIWPMLGLEAADAGAAVALVNAVLGADSSRLHASARFLLGPAYRRLHAVGAVAAEDGQRFAALGVPRGRTFVTGDARFDQVWKRIQSLDTSSPMLAAVSAALGDALVVVAGSTWPADDEILLRSFKNARAQTDAMRGNRLAMVIAPHEPTGAHLQQLEQRLDAMHLNHARLSTIGAESGVEPGAESGMGLDVVVVDSVGVLADLYAIADVAYVGGGFGDNGLHSVVEPAALGVPVVYGPRHGNAREAGDLAAAGGGFIVENDAALTARFAALADATARDLAGTAAESFVRTRLGGADANASIICGLMKTATAS